MYAEGRRVTDPAVLETVEAMWAFKTPRKGILAYMTSKCDLAPTVKDVDNLLARLKAAMYVDQPSVEARVNEVIRDFSACDGHVARVFTDTTKSVQSVTLQTAHTRTMFQRFPDVVLEDATHNTNNAYNKVFSFMIHDAFGNGQHVQVSFCYA